MAEGRIHWISGPVLRARSSDPFHVQDAIAVGPSGLLGEIVRLGTEEIVAQVYEDTTGLKPGDVITGTGEPLSVKLGPSLLGQIFDGLLRPLGGAGNFVRPGAGNPPNARFGFTPGVHVGDTVRAGQSLGAVATPRPQQCLAPPLRGGVVVSIAAAGGYTEDESICTLRRASADCRSPDR
jgi:V/A-type H+/Na+-transporting ATPase subunit A